MIVVVGSVNTDLVFEVERSPRPGETVLASSLSIVHGGKGANQSVAAARLGGSVLFIGAVGTDDAGTTLTDGLEADSVDISHVRYVAGSSGTAVVSLDHAGENSIIVAPEANLKIVIRPDDERVIAAAHVVVCQLEIPLATVLQTAQLTTGTFILNAAPATALPRELLDKIDVLIVNEVECATIFGSVETSDIRASGIPTVVTTLGSRGAMLTTQSRVDSIPAPIVDVLDTTGAGDTFCGAFAQAIDAGMDTAIAARRAVVAASIATTKLGARSAMPDTKELERKLTEMTGRNT